MALWIGLGGSPAAFAAYLAEIRGLLSGRQVDESINVALGDLISSLQRSTPGYPSGHVWKEWDYVRRGRGQNSYIEVSNSSPASAYLEFGTVQHVIRAKRGEALAFQGTGRSGGGIMFVAKPGYVWHPGTKPTKFATKALRRWLRQYPELGSFVTVIVGGIRLV